jgi:hypothetical protein
MASPATVFWIADYVNRHSPAESGPAYLALFTELLFVYVCLLYAVVSAGIGIAAAIRRKNSIDWWMIALVNLTVIYPHGLI